MAVWFQRHSNTGQHRVEAGGGEERVESLEAQVQGFLYFHMWINVADGTAGHGFCVWYCCGRCHYRQWQEEGRTECVGWSLGGWCGRAWHVSQCCRAQAGWRRGSVRVLRVDGLFCSQLRAREGCIRIGGIWFWAAWFLVWIFLRWECAHGLETVGRWRGSGEMAGE